MNLPEITRRTFLATTTVALASGSTAAAAAGPRPPARPRIRQDVQDQQGNAGITISVTPAQDVTEIDYTITDVGSVPDTFTVWYTDLKNGRQSRKLSYPLNPGESASAEVYGSLNHSFLVNVCQSDGTCFSVGPVGPGPEVAPRGFQAPAAVGRPTVDRTR
jgi:hypothetical protein